MQRNPHLGDLQNNGSRIKAVYPTISVEAYRILGEADELFERTRKVDSLINVRIELGDSLLVQPYVEGTYDDAGELP